MQLRQVQWDARAYCDFRKMLGKSADEAYRVFHQRLCKTSALPILGVRLPILQDFAKEIAAGDVAGFLEVCAPETYEEVMVQGIVIAKIKQPLEQKLPLLEAFISQIDNWAVCDCFCAALKPKPKESALLFDFCKRHIVGERPYEIRMAIVLLMQYLLKPDYIDEILEMLLAVPCTEYYVSMAVAWNLSFCFVKFREKTLSFLTIAALEEATFHRTIRKILDSRRVSEADKAYVRQLRQNSCSGHSS